METTFDYFNGLRNNLPNILLYSEDKWNISDTFDKLFCFIRNSVVRKIDKKHYSLRYLSLEHEMYFNFNDIEE